MANSITTLPLLPLQEDMACAVSDGDPKTSRSRVTGIKPPGDHLGTGLQSASAQDPYELRYSASAMHVASRAASV